MEDGGQSWRLSAGQWRSSQSRGTSKPMISGCDEAFILSSFEFVVLADRMQPFETMKRDGADLLSAWPNHKMLMQCTAPSSASSRSAKGMHCHSRNTEATGPMHRIAWVEKQLEDSNAYYAGLAAAPLHPSTHSEPRPFKLCNADCRHV